MQKIKYRTQINIQTKYTEYISIVTTNIATKKLKLKNIFYKETKMALKILIK